MIRTAFATCIALCAFAANSVLCRLALADGAIDPVTFSLVRLVAGVFALAAFCIPAWLKTGLNPAGSWRAGCALLVYLLAFSLAYVTLDTATGALILFGAVQVTMIGLALIGGTRLNPLEWAGVLVALAGFGWLMLPGASAPSGSGFLLMCLAGSAWGVYTLAGRHSAAPLQDSFFNFLRAVPGMVVLAPLLFLFTGLPESVSVRGLLLACASGALASGAGYAIWYIALRGLTSVAAGVLQLTVPLVAAVGGVVFVGEALNGRVMAAGAVLLGGVLLVILARGLPAK